MFAKAGENLTVSDAWLEKLNFHCMDKDAYAQIKFGDLNMKFNVPLCSESDCDTEDDSSASSTDNSGPVLMKRINNLWR